MAKTETDVNTLKINRGTYAKVQENLSSITENELIITSDKNVPIPTTNDNGKAVVVNASGEYELGNAGMSQSDADARYLKLAGGTMTGPITYGDSSFQTLLTNGTNKEIITANSTNLNIGNINKVLSVRSTNSNINHNRGGIDSPLFDTGNTSRIMNYSGTVPANNQVTSAITMPDGSGTSWLGALSVNIRTTAPTSDNTVGLQFVVLTAEPVQYFDGYYYLILSSNS